MNMFARFDENPAMTLRVIKKTKRYRRKDGQRENSIPTTNKVCGGIANKVCGGYNNVGPDLNPNCLPLSKNFLKKLSL